MLSTTKKRLRPAGPRRLIGWAALPLTLATLTVAAVLPATAGASGGGCTYWSIDGIGSCVEVDGWNNYVQVVRASVHVAGRDFISGRLHIWGPGRINYTHPVSLSTWDGGAAGWTWGVNRNIPTGPVCAQFEEDLGSGWQRVGAGPACLTVHS